MIIEKASIIFYEVKHIEKGYFYSNYTQSGGYTDSPVHEHGLCSKLDCYPETI